jgi:carbamoyl-phosphate synthase large subunit
VAEKYGFTDEARILAEELGLPLYATRGTAEMLAAVGIACTAVEKAPAAGALSGLDVIEQGYVDLVINVPREYDEQGRPDGYHIRRQAIDCGVPLVTDLAFARALVEALRARRLTRLEPVAWNDFASHIASDHGTRESRPAAAR